MNNCRAGLYSFASTTAWLRKTGMASPSYLVTLGLTLPDSRILVGVAGIGLTLVNIAIILPHLRQPILDIMHVNESTPNERTEQLVLPLEDYNSAHLLDLTNTSLTSSVSVKSVCSRSIVAEVVLCPSWKTDEALTRRSPDVGSLEEIKVNNPLTRQGRSAFQVPLPIPDAEEIAFFDAEEMILFDGDFYPEEPLASYEQSSDPEEDFTIEAEEPITSDSEFIDWDNQLFTVTTIDPEKASWYAEIGEDFTDIAIPVTNVRLSPRVAIHHPVASDATHHLLDSLTACEGTSPVSREKCRRPESLNFVPQSVVRRYPSAAIIPAGRLEHCSGHVYQLTPTLPPLVHNRSTLQTGHITSEGYQGTTFLMDVQPNKRGMEHAVETMTHEQRVASLSEPFMVHELASCENYPVRKRRLGLFARAVLRSRRSAARWRSNRIDGSSTSDSDSDSDSDSESQYSSGTSTNESMLPCMLGADLIAAIDANSESGLNLADPQRTNDTYDDFLVPENSATNVSTMLHVSSIEDASSDEAKTRATLGSLTYEDIQQWASGVVQKCARQVCRDRASTELLSPTQASDVCAERPSGAGPSQCPLSGLHCKLGTATAPTSGIKEAPMSLPATTILPARKYLSVRHIRDVPEFVPRQRCVSVVAGRGDPCRSAMDATRDAAARVIARFESEVGFK